MDILIILVSSQAVFIYDINMLQFVPVFLFIWPVLCVKSFEFSIIYAAVCEANCDKAPVFSSRAIQ